MVTIIKDGVRYTNPADVFIPRNEKTEMFYRIVENYQPKEKPKAEKQEDGTA